MWTLDRSQIALQRAYLMFGPIAEDGSLGRRRALYDGMRPALYRHGLVSSHKAVRVFECQWYIYLTSVY